jgi:hypothetical protein
MNTLDERIELEVASLVKTGTQILKKSRSLPEYTSMQDNDLAEVTKWITRLGQLIRRLYGLNSQHYDAYSSALTALNVETYYSIYRENKHLPQMLGIAQTIQHDLDTGLLENFKSLIQADVFADFFEMGEYLLQEGYKDAAAVIIGSVLENGLRKLAESTGVKTISDSGKPLTIDPLNAELAKSDIYSKLKQKEITSWAHIRNKAAHGEFSEYDKGDVRKMLLFVQEFTSKHLN